MLLAYYFLSYTPVTPAKPTRNRQKTQSFQWISQLSATDNVAEDTVKPVGFMSGSFRVGFGMESPDLGRYITDMKPIENRSLAQCWNSNQQQTDNPELKPITNRQHTDHKPTQILISKNAKSQIGFYFKNDLAPIKWHAIIITNAKLDSWHMYASISHNEFVDDNDDNYLYFVNAVKYR